MHATVQIAGVPVEVRAGFVASLLASAAAAALWRTPLAGAVWVVVATAAVVVHGLGQALVLRTYGVEPRLVLWLLGDHAPAPRLTRGAQVTVLLAGPATGIVLGMPLLALAARDVVQPGVGEEVLLLASWAVVGWATCSLLPILPFTGGQLLVEVLGRRRPATARRRVLHASVVVAAAAAGAAAATEQLAAAAAFGVVAAWDLGCSQGWWTSPIGAPPTRTAAAPLLDAPWDVAASTVPAALTDAVRALRLGAGTEALRSLEGIDHHAQAPIVRRFARELTGWACVQVGDLTAANAAADALAARDPGRAALRAAVAVAAGDADGPRRLARSLGDPALGREVRGLAVDLVARHGVAAEVAVAQLSAGDLEGALGLQRDLEAAGRAAQAAEVERSILAGGS